MPQLTELYVHLSYEEYKKFEAAIRAGFDSMEKSHTSGGKDSHMYHNSVRLPLGDIIMEVHGPVVNV